MSIISKLKGEKKAAKNGASQAGGNNATKDTQTRPDTMKRNWTAEDMRQVNRTMTPQLSRANSELSVRSSRHRSARSSSSLSQEWNASQHRSSSLKAQARNASFQGLAKVMEQSNDETDHDVPPMPAVPTRYSAGSTASSPRPRAVHSPHSGSGSMIGKSPLSSAETTPVDSEDSSNASSKSEDILEMRSHPFCHPEQYVFRKTQDLEFEGKGKAPLYSLGDSLDKDNQHVVEIYEPDLPSPEAPRQRKYFTRATPTGAYASDLPPATAVAPAVAPKEAKPAKKNRFSFRRRSGQAITA